MRVVLGQSPLAAVRGDALYLQQQPQKWQIMHPRWQHFPQCITSSVALPETDIAREVIVG